MSRKNEHGGIYCIGDDVSFRGKKAKIIEVYPKNVQGIFEYYIELYNDLNISRIRYDAYENELDWWFNVNPHLRNQCECGAWAQIGFENFHSDYCPLYKEIK